MEQITRHIIRTTLPYKDIYTTVCLIRTDRGALLFDTGSYAEDVPAYIMPFLSKACVRDDELKYVFISHNHSDHAGGLGAFLERYPDICILSRSEDLRARYAWADVRAPEENDIIMGALKVVPIPGHTADSAALLDMRTGTLVTGDCLQLRGIYGSGKWGANISFPAGYLKALEKLRGLEIEEIYAAHDYHPCGHHFKGSEQVTAAIDACIAPLRDIAGLIRENPAMDDDGICALYNAQGLPVIGAHVVRAVRNAAQDICSLYEA